MKKQDLLSILFTFLMGFAVGVYVYITGAANFLTTLNTADQSDSYEYVVVADVYGNCGGSCPSFRLDSTGGYRYITWATTSADQIVREGRLPLTLRQAVSHTMVAETLRRQSEPLSAGVCTAPPTGEQVRYSITTASTTYVLDSCTTAIDQESDLWRSLSRVVTYLEVN